MDRQRMNTSHEHHLGLLGLWRSLSDKLAEAAAKFGGTSKELVQEIGKKKLESFKEFIKKKNNPQKTSP